VTFDDLVRRQIASGLAGLSGSAANATIRVSAAALNEAIAAALPPDGRVRTVTVNPLTENALDVTVVLKPALLPALHPRLIIERQATLPGDPVLVLRVTGAAGSLMPLARLFGVAAHLPPGVRLEADRLFVNLHEALDARGQAGWLDYVTELHVGTDESALVVRFAVHVRAPK